MKVLNDWKCTAPDCANLDKVQELFLERATVPNCELCSGVLRKELGGLKTKHVSWSTWQI